MAFSNDYVFAQVKSFTAHLNTVLKLNLLLHVCENNVKN